MFIDLFQAKSGNALYNQLKDDKTIWHKYARNHWNNIYNQYKNYLDKDFPGKFSREFLNCLWELKLVSYFGSLKKSNLEIIKKGKLALPDLKWSTTNASYYIEAICPTKGNLTNYPYLNTQLSNLPVCRDVTAGHGEYRERMVGAFREKAVCKYDPSNCDLTICHHKHKKGYKNNIENHGYIIAISMSDIPSINQPMNYRVDLSCFFPFSPYMTINIDQSENFGDTYHTYTPSFNKGNKENSKISVDIFGNNKYSHVSAVLISRCWQVLFPNLSQYEQFLNFGIICNDFMLIHNPFADYRLEAGLLPVERELMAEHDNEEFTIHTMGAAIHPA